MALEGMNDMENRATDSLGRRAFSGSLKLSIALAVLIFLPAGSLGYWQGWVFWANCCACVAAVTLYFLKRDPALVERRLKGGPAAEREAKQKPVQLAASIVF